MLRTLVGSGLLLATAGCASRASGPIRLTSALAQTISLLGDTLYGVPRTAEGGPERARNIATARDAMARDSSGLEIQLLYARATAESGYLRDAVERYSRMMGAWSSEPRVYRERGELLFRLRQFESALGDLRKAALLLIGRTVMLDGGPIGYGPRDGSLAVSTVQFQVFFFQGLALYAKGDYSGAAPVLLEAVRQAETTEDRARALLWLFFSVRRLGDGTQAARVLDLARPEWTQLTDTPELELLLAFKGLLSTDSIRVRALGNDEAARILSYGLGYSCCSRRTGNPTRRAGWNGPAGAPGMRCLPDRGSGPGADATGRQGDHSITGAAGLEPATSRLTAGRSAN